MTFIRDVSTMTKRSYKLALRNLDSLVTTIVLPILMLLAFVYIFGGAIASDGSYIDYIVPGIVILGVGQVAAGIGISIATMKEKGILNRFKTMNINQSAVLLGEVIINLLKNGLSSVLVIVVAMLIGFSPQLTFLNMIVFAGFIFLYASVIIWFAFYIGLVASPEAAAVFPMVLIFLPYLSSGFVPVDTMPNWLSVVSEYSPFTPITEVSRGLLFDNVQINDVWQSLVWLVGLLIVGVALTIHKYQRMTIR